MGVGNSASEAVAIAARGYQFECTGKEPYLSYMASL